jgi:RNA polymerase sigma-70 factor (ECF subfamily)
MSQSALETLSERELVQRAIGDKDAFALLYRTYVDSIYRYCYRRLRNREAAEDVTQTVFERAIKGLSRYRDQNSFRGWLFTIAHNEIVDQARRTRVSTPLDETIVLYDPYPTPEEAALVADSGLQLRLLIAKLSDEDQQLIDLRLAGLNDREIAGVVGMSHGAVRTRQYRALQRLRTLSIACSGGGRNDVMV